MLYIYGTNCKQSETVKLNKAQKQPNVEHQTKVKGNKITSLRNKRKNGSQL